MTIVDVEYEIYRCPHCSGYLIIRMQFPVKEFGCSVSLEHWEEIPEYLKMQPISKVELIK